MNRRGLLSLLGLAPLAAATGAVGLLGRALAAPSATLGQGWASGELATLFAPARTVLKGGSIDAASIRVGVLDAGGVTTKLSYLSAPAPATSVIRPLLRWSSPRVLEEEIPF